MNRSNSTQSIPLNIVGSSTFGRYPKISVEKTYNMFESDGWLVPYAGYESVSNGSQYGNTKGRAIYTSNLLNCMIGIWDTNVYKITILYDTNKNEYVSNFVKIGNVGNYNSDIFIAENPRKQIMITDGYQAYVYDEASNPSFYIVKANEQNDDLDFRPGFVTYQDTQFICASIGTNDWRLSNSTTDLNYSQVYFPLRTTENISYIGNLITKPDNVVATLRVPSRGNMLYVFGSNVVEAWFNQGLTEFPYQKSQSFNIDYGCVNPSTIAWNDEYVVWLAQNEKSGPIIMYTDGGTPEKITTDGIDHFLSSIQSPSSSEAFMYRQDGHLFYHINFYQDNVSLFYDFNTKKFYHACDENGNYFIAKEVAFYNNQYYFISEKSGDLFAFDTDYNTFNGRQIPRKRICKNVRLPTQEYFIVNDVGFTIEQGTTNYYYIPSSSNNDVIFITEDGKEMLTEDDKFMISEQGLTIYDLPVTPRVDMSISVDGGESFGNRVPYNMNSIGHSRNMLRYWRLGIANDFVVQFEFWGIGRFLCTNGLVNIRQ